MQKIIGLLLVCFLLTGCASKPLSTVSGRPEAIFADKSIDEVKSLIMNGCTSKGIPVMETNANQIICGKTMTGGDGVFAQLLMGNAYSTTPVRKVQFTIFSIENVAKVTTREWIELQMAFGQTKQQELDSTAQMQAIQDFLLSIGGK